MSETRNISLRRAETVGFFALATQLVLAALTYGISAYCKSAAVEAEAWHLVAGIWIWLVVILHLRHRRLATEEVAEIEELERARREKLPGSALFDRDEDDLFRARARRQAFEKYWVPILSVVMVLILGGLATYCYRSLFKTLIPKSVGHAPVSGAFVVGQALVLFLIAKYAAGMGTERAWRPLRAGASYMVSCAAVLFVVGVGLALVHFETPRVDKVLAYVVPGCMVLIAIEMLLNVLLDIYRPRVEGQEPHFSYDSRLLGLLVEPGTIVHTISETLDYQFGFKVSDTWVYRFVERAIAPLFLFQVVTFYLLTCLLIVAPEENAFVERFGKPKNAANPLGPGLHLKWPWPIERVRRFPAKRIRELSIGQFSDVSATGEPLKAILWTESHEKIMYKWMVASREQLMGSEPGDEKTVPVNFITGIISVYYRIANLYDYAYGHVDAQKTLEQFVHRECVRYMASVDVNELLTSGRRSALSVLKERIQEQGDMARLGVEVLSVGLQDIHPPVEVGKAYEKAVGAIERKEATILKAEGYRNRVMPLAEAEATIQTSEAEVYRYERAGSPQLRVRDIVDWRGFCTRLNVEGNGTKPSPGKRIWDLLPGSSRQTVADEAQGELLTTDRQLKLVAALNELMGRRDLWRSEDLDDVSGPDELRELLKRKREALSDAEVQWLNRLVLDECYPREIEQSLDKIVSRLEAKRFEQLLIAYKKAPKVFRSRRRLMAMVDGIGSARKYVVPSWARVLEVDVIDLQEKLQLDILNTDIEAQ